MTAEPAPRPGWELLAGQVNQRRYEALRAYLFEGASLQQAADATGYTRDALASLVRDLRRRLAVFAPPGTPGPKNHRNRYLSSLVSDWMGGVGLVVVSGQGVSQVTHSYRAAGVVAAPDGGAVSDRDRQRLRAW